MVVTQKGCSVLVGRGRASGTMRLICVTNMQDCWDSKIFIMKAVFGKQWGFSLLVYRKV